MLTKSRIAELRKGRACSDGYWSAGVRAVTHNQQYPALCDCQVLQLLDHIEKQDRDIKTLAEAIEARVKLDAFGVSSNGILCEALAKVYGEEISDGKIMDMAAKQARENK